VQSGELFRCATPQTVISVHSRKSAPARVAASAGLSRGFVAK
jgi:hypothetical protein